MVDFTEEERQQIALAMMGDGDAVVGVQGADAKDVFCKNWDVAKTVLEYIAPLIPGIGKLVLGGIIKAGDILHRKIC